MLRGTMGCYYKLAKLHFSDLKLRLETKMRRDREANGDPAGSWERFTPSHRETSLLT